MYGVLIAEDELLVRLGLRSSIDWKKFDMCVLADVSDGLSAWEAYQKERPDIIVTDIRMPALDGMELIRRIRQVDSGARIVILTCLEDFSLVQQAIALGVSNYFLKLSMTQADLEATFAKLRDELDRNNDRLERDTRRTESDAAREQLFKGFLLYGRYTEAEFQAYVQSRFLPLHPENLQVCALELDNYHERTADHQDHGGQIVMASVRSALGEVLQGAGNGIAFRDDAGRYVLILNQDGPQASSQPLQAMAQKIQSMLGIYFNIAVTLAASRVAQGYGSLRGLYDEALEALGQKFYLGGGALYMPDPAVARQAFCRWMEALGGTPGVAGLLGEAKAGEFSRDVGAFSCALQPKQAIREFVAGQIQWLSGQLDYAVAPDVSAAVLTALRDVEQAGGLADIVGIFQQFVSHLRDVVVRRPQYSGEISAALHYIHSNYRHDITLNQVARSVNLSAGYLSNLFKKEVGDNFVAYLNHIRIEKAKRLLADSTLKAYDIAGQVGFTDSAYFCKVFKKAVGCSPVQYRGKWRGALKGEPDEMEPQADTH